MSQFNRRSFFGFAPLAVLAFLAGKKPERATSRPVEKFDLVEHWDAMEAHWIPGNWVWVNDASGFCPGMTVGVGDSTFRIHEIRKHFLCLETM